MRFERVTCVEGTPPTTGRVAGEISAMSVPEPAGT
jgi:hypothetical protein